MADENFAILSKFSGRERPYWALQGERAGWSDWNHCPVACSCYPKPSSEAATQRGHGQRWAADLHGIGRQKEKLQPAKHSVDVV